MHHKYDITSKDASYIIDLAAAIFIENFDPKAKRYILSPHFTFSSASLFHLIWEMETEADEKEK